MVKDVELWPQRPGFDSRPFTKIPHPCGTFFRQTLRSMACKMLRPTVPWGRALCRLRQHLAQRSCIYVISNMHWRRKRPSQNTIIGSSTNFPSKTVMSAEVRTMYYLDSAKRQLYNFHLNKPLYIVTSQRRIQGDNVSNVGAISPNGWIKPMTECQTFWIWYKTLSSE